MAPVSSPSGPDAYSPTPNAIESLSRQEQINALNKAEAEAAIKALEYLKGSATARLRKALAALGKGSPLEHVPALGSGTYVTEHGVRGLLRHIVDEIDRTMPLLENDVTQNQESEQ
jgi:hypothetical protein